MSSPTRWSLLEAVAAGDEAARSEFVAQYRPVVQRYLEGRGLGAEAEDVAQEVFVRLVVKGGLSGVAQEKGSFRSYLFAVTRNALRDHLRRAQAQRRGGQVEIERLEREPSQEERQGFDREWLLGLLEVVLARLEREHPNYYAAVRGFLLEERSQAEVAEALNQGIQDVRNHVHRGRRKLAEYVQEEIARYEREPGRFATEVEAVSRLLGGESPGASGG